MTLEELLKRGNCRLSMDNKWLIWSDGEWLVLERKYYARNNTTLYRGGSIEYAIDILESE
jgi:hypothetical protein